MKKLLVILAALVLIAIILPRHQTGDINHDGIVDGADLAFLAANWKTTNPKADLNGDGMVDGTDLSILLSNYRSK